MMKRFLIVTLCLLWIASPLDPIPDFIPIAGQADDLVALLIGLRTVLASPQLPPPRR
jgi:uncharacterized membrane protein YkvA (DUF1232 family)